MAIVVLALLSLPLLTGCDRFRGDPALGKWELWEQTYDFSKGTPATHTLAKSGTVELKRRGALDWPGLQFNINGVEVTDFRWGKRGDVYEILACVGADKASDRQDHALVIGAYRLAEGRLVEVDSTSLTPLLDEAGKPSGNVLLRPSATGAPAQSPPTGDVPAKPSGAEVPAQSVQTQAAVAVGDVRRQSLEV